MGSPLTIIGALILVIGWLLLFFGSGIEVGGLSRQVVNVHQLAIAQSTILTGGLLIICGFISDGFNRLGVKKPTFDSPPAPRAAPDTSAQELEELKRTSHERFSLMDRQRAQFGDPVKD